MVQFIARRTHVGAPQEVQRFGVGALRGELGVDADLVPLQNPKLPRRPQMPRAGGRSLTEVGYQIVVFSAGSDAECIPVVEVHAHRPHHCAGHWIPPHLAPRVPAGKRQRRRRRCTLGRGRQQGRPLAHHSELPDPEDVGVPGLGFWLPSCSALARRLSAQRLGAGAWGLGPGALGLRSQVSGLSTQELGVHVDHVPRPTSNVLWSLVSGLWSLADRLLSRMLSLGSWVLGYSQPA